MIDEMFSVICYLDLVYVSYIVSQLSVNPISVSFLIGRAYVSATNTKRCLSTRMKKLITLNAKVTCD